MNEQLLKAVIRTAAALGAEHIDIENTNLHVLAFEGLALVIARMAKQPMVLSLFVNRVRQLQNHAYSKLEADPCNDPSATEERNTEHLNKARSDS